MILTVDTGVCPVLRGPGVHAAADGYPGDAYLGGTLQLDLRGPIAANIFAGLGGCALAVVGGTARYAGGWHGPARWTAGAGPMVGFGATVYAEADFALEVRSRPGFAVVLGPKVSVSLWSSDSQNSQCISGCLTGLPAGTYLALFRLGLGFNL